MTVNQLIDKIEKGSDILFDVMGRHFTILTWTDRGIGIDEQDPHNHGMQYFPSAEELVHGHLVDGIPLADLTDRIVITDYT